MARRHPLRILLAEDNAINQKVALRILERLGYRADVAANGLEVIQAVKRQRYDVILMDVQMPEMDGLEATRQICSELPKEERPRIVGMTAHALAGDRESCQAAGMQDYISKPVRIGDVARALCDTPPQPRAVGQEARTDPGDAEEVLDGDALKRLRDQLGEDKPDMFGEVITAFLCDAPVHIEQMEAALTRGDASALGRGADTLKSTSEMVGARILSGICKEIETSVRHGNLPKASEALARTLTAFQAAQIQLERETAKARS
jgi:CheY-like chemotaxis protein